MLWRNVTIIHSPSQHILGSALLFNNRSTIYVWPSCEAVYNGESPSQHILGSALLFNICYVGSSPLYIATHQSLTGIVKVLLNNKADPNICYEGISPLYFNNTLIISVWQWREAVYNGEFPTQHILGSALLLSNSLTISVYRDCQTVVEK
jgi:hypothetical protein